MPRGVPMPSEPRPTFLENGCFLSACCVLGFGLWFAPGWANGWPFGLHRNLVWPLGLACLVFGAVSAVASDVGKAFHEDSDPADSVRHRGWLWGSAAVAAVIAVLAFV